MKTVLTSHVAAIAIVAACGLAHAGEAETTCTDEQSCATASLTRAIFGMLPVEHRERIERVFRHDADRVGDELARENGQDPMTLYGVVARYVDRDAFATFRPVHQKMLIAMADRAHSGDPVAPLCFTPDTDPRVAAAFDAVVMAAAANGNRFQQIGRWGPTALNPGGTDAQGETTTLTYSYAPDGTFVPDLIGPTGNSNLFAWLNGIYGSPDVWQPIFDDAFAEWGSLSGVTYVYEPNDDGSTLNTLPGESGVRGDLRIAAIFIDGDSGTLAYNNFPQDGDMVFDSGDGFFDNLAFNSRGFINVIQHEHGHGMGQLHTCPIERAKLMEPFVSLRYQGPQSDDILNAQRHYGDNYEPNDSRGIAFDFGQVGLEERALPQVASIDGFGDNDWYRFEALEPTSITAFLDVFGERYLDNPQTAFCDIGSYLDTRIQQDLTLLVTDASGNAIEFANAGGLGEDEELVALLPTAGTYYLRVTGGGPDLIQGYNLRFRLDTPIVIRGTGDSPDVLQPGVQTAVEFEIDQVGALDAEGLVLLSSANGEAPFTETDLSQLGNGNYCGVIPAFSAGDRPGLAVGRRVGSVIERVLPREDLLRPTVGAEVLIFEDDAEADRGWTPSATGSDGQWERGFPEGNLRGDPIRDASTSGNGRAWLTDVDPGTTNSDVDGGGVTLTSPAFDMRDGGRVELQLWYTNDDGASPGEDTAELEVSNDDGNSWTLVLQIGPDSPPTRWQEIAFDIADFVSPSDEIRIRYTANDDGAGSIVEAGLDEVRVFALRPNAVPDPACAGTDLTTDNTNPGDCGFGVADGEVSVTDLTFLVERWVGGDTSADLTTDGANPGDAGFGVPDGNVTVTDLTFFVEAWIGCS
ncbi:MAG: GC-type dockerin domain-anchored protein [Planctomycetota bacterium]